MNLTEILAYANILTEDGFDSISDAIHYFNEAQAIISGVDPVKAEPMDYVLSGDTEIQLPDDLLSIKRATLDGRPFRFSTNPWNGNLQLGQSLTGVLRIWYTRLPAELLVTTLDQVPEVREAYHRTIATYAAKMYHLVDDDPQLREAFRNEFEQSVALLKPPESGGFISNYYNFF